MRQLRKSTGAYTRILHSGRELWLNSSEYRVYSLLKEGGCFATFDIANRLNIPDPRSVIRYLRKMGIDVVDVWVHENKMRFKRYFIHGGGAVC